MTGSASDPIDWQPHVRNKQRRDLIARRFKDPEDDLELVIVRDMWLTGFDMPSLHTMYIDKPMSGHNLMQAIARVNRVLRDKPGGLVVDYLGIADSLKRALTVYAESGGRGRATIDQAEAVAVMKEKYEVVQGILHGYDYQRLLTADPQIRLQGIAEAMDFILAKEDGKKRYLQAVVALSKAFALAVPHEEALAIRDEVRLFQEIRAALIKTTVSVGERTLEEIEAAVQQLISKAVSGREVVDIFAAAGFDKPDISILSDEFLAEVRALPQKNLWANDERLANIVFTSKKAEEKPLSRHLTLEDPKVRGLSMRLPPFAPGQPVPVITFPGLSPEIVGFWSLWRISISTADWNRRRIMPLFLADDGRVFGPTSRHIWHQLLVTKPTILTFLDVEISHQAFQRLQEAAEI